MAQDLNLQFQRKHRGGQPVHGKELNINSHQENGNQNLIISHLLKWLLSKKTRHSKCWRECGEMGALCALLVEMQTGLVTMENSMKVP